MLDPQTIQPIAGKGVYYLAMLTVVAYIVTAIFQTAQEHSNKPEDKTANSIHLAVRTWGTAAFFITVLLYFISTVAL